MSTNLRLQESFILSEGDIRQSCRVYEFTRATKFKVYQLWLITDFPITSDTLLHSKNIYEVIEACIPYASIEGLHLQKALKILSEVRPIDCLSDITTLGEICDLTTFSENHKHLADKISTFMQNNITAENINNLEITFHVGNRPDKGLVVECAELPLEQESFFISQNHIRPECKVYEFTRATVNKIYHLWLITDLPISNKKIRRAKNIHELIHKYLPYAITENRYLQDALEILSDVRPMDCLTETTTVREFCNAAKTSPDYHKLAAAKVSEFIQNNLNKDDLENMDFDLYDVLGNLKVKYGLESDDSEEDEGWDSMDESEGSNTDENLDLYEDSEVESDSSEDKGECSIQ
ncbi:MAG: hypothetical protein WC222_01270 [Parachlamydiales bacterium]|jgi:hypothetical protein